MNVKKASFIFISSSVFIGMVVLGVLTRRSYINDININSYINDKNINFSTSKYEEDITKVFTKFEDLSTLEDLEEVSPIIVKVKVESELPRNRYYLTTLTTVRILEVLKGDINKDLISIFEPIDVTNIIDSNDVVTSLDGYNWLKEGNEYILFLRSLKDSHYSHDSVVYLPTTTILSKYGINRDKASKLDKEKVLKNNFKYSDISNQEVILYEDKNIDKFNYFKNEVLNKYK